MYAPSEVQHEVCVITLTIQIKMRVCMQSPKYTMGVCMIPLHSTTQISPSTLVQTR